MRLAESGAGQAPDPRSLNARPPRRSIHAGVNALGRAPRLGGNASAVLVAIADAGVGAASGLSEDERGGCEDGKD